MRPYPACGPLSVPCAARPGFLLHPGALLCDLAACVPCPTLRLIAQTAKAAIFLESLDPKRERAYSLAAAFPHAPEDPAELSAWAGPKIDAAVAGLQRRYIGGLEVRTIREQSQDGLANAHLVIRSKGTPRKGAWRHAFEQAGLGAQIGEPGKEIERMEFSLAVLSYVQKTALTALLVEKEFARLPLEAARTLNGGEFFHDTPGFASGIPASLVAPTSHEFGRVFGWTQAKATDCASKAPPSLREALITNGSEAFISLLHQIEGGSDEEG